MLSSRQRYYQIVQLESRVCKLRSTNLLCSEHVKDCSAQSAACWAAGVARVSLELVSASLCVAPSRGDICCSSPSIQLDFSECLACSSYHSTSSVTDGYRYRHRHNSYWQYHATLPAQASTSSSCFTAAHIPVALMQHGGGTSWQHYLLASVFCAAGISIGCTTTVLLVEAVSLAVGSPCGGIMATALQLGNGIGLILASAVVQAMQKK